MSSSSLFVLLAPVVLAALLTGVLGVLAALLLAPGVLAALLLAPGVLAALLTVVLPLTGAAPSSGRLLVLTGGAPSAGILLLLTPPSPFLTTTPLPPLPPLFTKPFKLSINPNNPNASKLSYRPNASILHHIRIYLF